MARKRQRRPQPNRSQSKTAPISNRTAQAAAAVPAQAPWQPGMPLTGSRRTIFIGICVACLLLATGAITWAVIRDGGQGSGDGGPMNNAGAPGAIARVATPEGALMFRNVLPGDHWNQVGVVPANEPATDRSMVPLRCLRIHFDGGRALCLAEGGGPAGTFSAYILDADLKETGRVRLGGIPSRTRVSPDGKYGATTSFVTGHSYAEDGFSTETLIIELESAKSLANLEEFTTYRDGEVFFNEDFNFWGVTFTNDTNIFYATLATGGKTYLVRGDIAAREFDVLRENVECPSISPDNTRIAFKKKVGGDLTGSIWRFHVLDLETMTETPLSETRSIDDQILWLDNDRLLYGDASDTWLISADGTGEPTRFMTRAISLVYIPSSEAGEAANEGDETGVEVLEMPKSDLEASISMPESATEGTAMSYQITVVNSGSTTATGVALDHDVPPDVELGEVVATDPPGIAYGCSMYPEEHRVRCTTPELDPGASWTTSVTITPGAPGEMSFTVDVGADGTDTTPENNRTHATMTVGE